MSTQTQEPVEMGTRPVKEHEWLNKLVGEWRVEAEMMMGPGNPMIRSEGTETVKTLGGLWAYAESKMTMGGQTMEHYSTLGYDLSFNEYRGCWFASMSSHLWKQTGTLSEDGKIMTLECLGPSMARDGEMVKYRDVIEIINENERTVTSYDADNGDWEQYMKAIYTRV